jgi:A/G-specific adenine glycosylase
MAATPDISEFRRTIRTFFRKHGRVFPWRQTRDPYAILLSEIMLQQTQTDRVVPKYEAFLKMYPNVSSLAQATTPALLKVWKGLGYNRRALHLRKAAQEICERYAGKVPHSIEELDALPGIGPYSAAAIATFAFGARASFIETNIRSVYLHTFFRDRQNVTDREILAVIGNSLPRQNLRTWYYGLMDYGVHLKKIHKSINKRSAHYQRQSPFKGSWRQKRGQIVTLLAKGKLPSPRILSQKLALPVEEVCLLIEELQKEGFM